MPQSQINRVCKRGSMWDQSNLELSYLLSVWLPVLSVSRYKYCESMNTWFNCFFHAPNHARWTNLSTYWCRDKTTSILQWMDSPHPSVCPSVCLPIDFEPCTVVVQPSLNAAPAHQVGLSWSIRNLNILDAFSRTEPFELKITFIEICSRGSNWQ